MAKNTLTSSEVNSFLRKNHGNTSRVLLSAKLLEQGFVISEAAIRSRLLRMGLGCGFKNTPKAPPVAEQVRQDRILRRAQHDKRSYKKRYDQLIDETEKLQLEVEAARFINEGHDTFTIKADPGSKNSEAVAVVLLSDWHVEEIVDPKTVNGLNAYNPDIAKKRAERVFQLIERMLRKEQQDINIKNLVLWLGGDFISGHIHDELKSITAMQPVEAADYARALLESGIEFLHAHTGVDIHIVCSVGNHARITQRVQASTEHGNSLEYFIYGALSRRFADTSGIRFTIAESYHTIVDVLGYKIRAHHGHFVRYGGGIGGLTIPLNKAIAAWNMSQNVDLDILGHFHQHMSSRRFEVNGSLIGFSPYAVSIKAEPQPPIQSMFLIDNKRGKTVSIPLYCDK